MDVDQRYARFQQLQRYVGWRADDGERLRQLAPYVESHFNELAADFYSEIERHEATRKVMVGGQQQVERLQATLKLWLRDLFSGIYDEAYVTRRWRVGLRHVEIGLDQQFANAALARIRAALTERIAANWRRATGELIASLVSLHRLLDLDLAIIEDAYRYEYVLAQKRTERLVAIGQMASGIAHELRNPLNVIQTSVFYLRNARRATPEKQLEHLDRIQRQVGIADTVIGALSDFAKLPLPNVGPVEVRKLVEDTLANHSPGERISVTVAGLDETPPLRGDARQIGIVLSNLVRNAADAMSEGGRLSIVAESYDEGGTRWVRLTVADTGPGIPAEQIYRIFEPFFSTKVRGIGLGLAICRAIVDNHGGKLRVASEPGSGSRFSLSVPAASQPAS
jgi:signal transduction histidine kinase